MQASAKEPAAAKALIDFITASAAAPVIRKCGMEPA
jgi:ABC-type molybdate transport system substrate-binding protein